MENILKLTQEISKRVYNWHPNYKFKVSFDNSKYITFTFKKVVNGDIKWQSLYDVLRTDVENSIDIDSLASYIISAIPLSAAKK